MRRRSSSSKPDRRDTPRTALFWLVAAACICIVAGPGSFVAAQVGGPAGGSNFDARLALRTGSPAVPAALVGVDALRSEMPDLAATFDDVTGVTRTLYNQGGYLTAAPPQPANALAAGLAFVQSQAPALGLSAETIAAAETTDVSLNRTTGSTHIYLRQRHLGIPVYNAQLQMNVNREGRVISVNNSFHPQMPASAAAAEPLVRAEDAVAAAARHLGIASGVLAAGAPGADAQRGTQVQAPAVSAQPVQAGLMWLPVTLDDVRLVWNFQVYTLDTQHAYDMTVDARSAEVMTRFDWVAPDQYRVYPQPAESPNHVGTLPPADGRTTVVNPANAQASPFGWHDTNGAAGAEFTIMRGNNAHAYDDADNNNAPPAVEPDCGAALDCTFPIDLTAAPPVYRSAAVANLFYWNNIIHDIQYQYGFTEAAGNFQSNNYGRGGAGNDAVRAEAQDGGGINNANFLTPPDGSAPRMQMYLFDATTPNRDGDFDSGIIVHEYGHGISNRLVGGPANVSCLNNAQQPGEGLGDWWSLVYTATGAGAAARTRGMGTYVLGQPTTGLGIRGQRYSTDPAVNTWTYASINGMSIPHGVGSVWAQAAWEMYWALVDRHGWSANLYDAAGSAGNLRAMLYVNEGLMNTICSPAFTDVRDGIIQAAQDNHGGADVCTLWQAFAGIGLGADAVSGGPNSTTPTNGFSLPGACLTSISISDVSVTEGNSGTKSAVFTVLKSSNASAVTVSYATADGTATGTSTSLANAGAIAVPDGNASPYPSTIAAPAGLGTITNLRVALHGFSHTFPSDVDVLLVGPTGQTALLMSDVGGSFGVSGLTLTFDDTGPALPASTLVSGTFRPTDLAGGSDLFPAPAPAAPYGSTLSGFNGTNPQGTWQLFVRDQFGLDTGSFSGGWSLTISNASAAADYVSTTGTLTIPAGSLSGTIPVTINGDTTVEPTETFTVMLSSPIGAAITDGTGTGTILNDDLSFTDHPLISGVTPPKAIHILELRVAINAARVTRGLAPVVFSEPAPAAGLTIRAAHINELRGALPAACTPVFTDSPLQVGVTPIRAVHIMEIRTAVAACQ